MQLSPADESSDLLFATPKKIEQLFDVPLSTQAKMRHLGIGPKFYKPAGTHCVRYQIGDWLNWLSAGEMKSTADLTKAQRGSRFNHVVGERHYKRRKSVRIGDLAAIRSDAHNT